MLLDRHVVSFLKGGRGPPNRIILTSMLTNKKKANSQTILYMLSLKWEGRGWGLKTLKGCKLKQIWFSETETNDFLGVFFQWNEKKKDFSVERSIQSLKVAFNWCAYNYEWTHAKDGLLKFWVFLTKTMFQKLKSSFFYTYTYN